MKDKFLLSFLVLALLIFSACSVSQDKILAEKAVKTFHKRYDEKKFEEIYKSSDDSYKDKNSQESAIKLLSTTHEKLGKVKNSKQVDSNVNATRRGTFARLNYETEFEKGRASEQFVFIVSGNNAALVDYNVKIAKAVGK